MKTIINSQGCNSVPGNVELEVSGDVRVSGKVISNGIELKNLNSDELEKAILLRVEGTMEEKFGEYNGKLSKLIEHPQDPQIAILAKKIETLEKLVAKLSQPSAPSKKEKADKQEQQ